MPRYSLRTLLIVMLLGGPALAGAWWAWQKYEAERFRRKIDALIPFIEQDKTGYSWPSENPPPEEQD